MNLIIIWGCILLLISLALAWLATLVMIIGVPALKKRFPAAQNIVKAHIDFLLMSLLLFAIFLLLEDMPMLLIIATLFGATVNPALFLVMATQEPPGKKPGPIFSAFAALSFIATTLGIGGAAVLILLKHI